MPETLAATGSRYRSLFSPSTRQEREQNFESYWRYTLRNDGEIIEDARDLTKKRATRERFLAEPVRSKKPLADPALFHRNALDLVDDPAKLDRKTLLMTCLYKFARHEWTGISAAWGSVHTMATAKTVVDRITRYHLCEEFCHIRLFEEIFRTMHLEVVWAPLGPWTERLYKTFPHFPEKLLDPPAFVTELMGLTFYLHLDVLLDDVLADEPAARDRIKQLLCEIMADELAHIGQRRNFLGPLSIKFAKWITPGMYKLFFGDIPETKLLFDVEQMAKDGVAFDYNGIPPEVIARSWVPSYCGGVEPVETPKAVPAPAVV